MAARPFLILLILGWGLPLFAVPQVSQLYSKAHLSDEPTWLGVKLQADNDNEIWTVSYAWLNYETGSTSGNANILDDVMRIQSIEVGTTPNFYDLVYQIPDEVLKLDTVNLTVSLAFSTNTGLTSPTISTTDLSVDLKSIREEYWTRIPGAQETVVTYSPGSYLTFDYNGAGVSAEIGIATNMGMVEASVDGTISEASLDLFPSDLPAGANVSSPPNTTYEDFSFSTGGASNEDHQLKISLLDTRNDAATGIGMAVTSFTVSRFTGDTQRLHELDVMTDNSNVILYSYPGPFDGNILLQRLGFSSNWQEGLPEIDESSDNLTTSSDNLATDDTLIEISGNTTSAKSSLKPKRAAGTASTYLIEVDNGSDKNTLVSDDLNELTLPIYQADQVHRITFHAIGPGGKARAVGNFYQTGLSNPITWSAGSSQIDLPDLEGVSLSRNETGSNWEVAVINSDIPGLFSQSQQVVVVQKPNSQESLSFSINGINALTPLEGEAKLKTGFSDSYDLQGNHVVVSPSSSLSGSGGGGGGCLLQ